jgi:hypothetical protein
MMSYASHNFLLKLRDEWGHAQRIFYDHLSVGVASCFTDEDEGDCKRLFTSMSSPVTCRKVVEHFGVDKILKCLNHGEVDKSGNYTLLIFTGNPYSPMLFLKMKNPSTGQWHLEAVHPGLATVDQALNWRNRGWFMYADTLT